MEIIEITEEEEIELKKRSNENTINFILECIRQYKMTQFIDDIEAEKEARQILADAMNSWLYSNDLYWKRKE